MTKKGLVPALIYATLLHHTALASPLPEPKPASHMVMSQASPTSGLNAIAQLGRSVRQALAITPDETRAMQTLVHAQALDRRARQDEQRAIAKINTLARLNDMLETQNARLNKERVHMMFAHASALEEVQKRHELTLLSMHCRLAEPQARALIHVDAQASDKQCAHRYCPAGTDRNASSQGDAPLSLAKRGITDDRSGSLCLPDEPPAIAPGEMTPEGVTENRHESVGVYLRTFRQGQGVNQAKSGFWYKIHSPGDTELSDDAVLSVVIRETLTDGTTVLAAGKPETRLTQPLGFFTPIFKEAIAMLNNHGSMTLVLPPGSFNTIKIFHITVIDVQSEAVKKGWELSASSVTSDISATGG